MAQLPPPPARWDPGAGTAAGADAIPPRCDAAAASRCCLWDWAKGSLRSKRSSEALWGQEDEGTPSVGSGVGGPERVQPWGSPEKWLFCTWWGMGIKSVVDGVARVIRSDSNPPGSVSALGGMCFADTQRASSSSSSSSCRGAQPLPGLLGAFPVAPFPNGAPELGVFQ